ncbi:hypothetical protein E2562_020874 [Oryza meyeriana var. granulata]|uniref:ABC transmembrane type-1 domain-containing protein n=1 Tax=Oryza meyeriana var. granulata TaxID=110450 RepID=A0A6G1D5W0_9ORYZ|nr:hypothetical protein E2562_020874 [Oryza meyeriana var. granulata]
MRWQPTGGIWPWVPSAAGKKGNLYLKTILRPEIVFFDKHTNTGQVVLRMSGDTVLIQDAMGEKAGKLIQLLVMFLGGFAVAFAQGWLLTLVMLATIPPLVFAGAMAAIVIEHIIGSIRTVASFTGEKQAVAKYNRPLKSAYSSGVSIRESLAAGVGMGMLLCQIASFCQFSLAGPDRLEPAEASSRAGSGGGGRFVEPAEERGCWVLEQAELEHEEQRQHRLVQAKATDGTALQLSPPVFAGLDLTTTNYIVPTCRYLASAAMEGAMVSALTEAMNSLLFKLTNLLESEHKSLKGLQREIGFLESELHSMNSMLQRLADMEETDAQTKEWRDRVRELAYDIEDCINLFMHQLGSITRKAGFIKKMAWKIKGLQLSHRISQQIQELKALVMEESDRHRRYHMMNIPSMSSEANLCRDTSGARARPVDP